MSKRLVWFASLSAFVLLSAVTFVAPSYAGVVEIKNNQLHVDGSPQPQLWGAEVQYFRLRGGPGKNIPREKVLRLWTNVLDRFQEAKMNAISFYIPWDFHEYAPGKFDFDGTADEDGDGRPDYPSRDLRTFLKMIEARGIKHMMVRPGPFINAEWGFVGFGAVPLWFSQKYPNSHMRNTKGQRTNLYSYHDPDFIRHSRLWLAKVHEEIISKLIGPGRPAHFLQVDNETNFMWQSLYSHDYGPRAVGLYQEWLKTRYGSIAAVNKAHGRSWNEWREIRAPANPRENTAEDQDWYRFQDKTIFDYLKMVRGTWHELGVFEPTVLFTLAESYNATENGLLPHFTYRNAPGQTGMMTVNLYPKTYETPDQPLLNNPFKADLDVKSADTASDHYLGRREEWVLGPEIQGGWWRGVPVSDDARRQTYLTTLGHGLKALFVYYFHEGDNWQNTWAAERVRVHYDQLKKDPRYKSISNDQLPDEFWNELNEIVHEKEFASWEARWILSQGGTQPEKLYFDAPLDENAEPRARFQLIKEMGEKIIGPNQDFLAQAVELTDPVCFIKDSEAHAPTFVPWLNSRLVNSDWAGGLLAYLMHSGVNPEILHWGLTPMSEYSKCRMLIYQDNGFANQDLRDFMVRRLAKGQTVVVFLHDALSTSIMKASKPKSPCRDLNSASLRVDGFACTIENGLLYQVRTPLYEWINSDSYVALNDLSLKVAFLDEILLQAKIRPHVRIRGGGDRVVAFARADQTRSQIWITAKSGRGDAYSGKLIVSLAHPEKVYDVKSLLNGRIVRIGGEELSKKGFPFNLNAFGSEAYLVKEVR